MPKLNCKILDREVYIQVADGTKLSARIWSPADADSNPVPAILEYIPYRKRDGF